MRGRSPPSRPWTSTSRRDTGHSKEKALKVANDLLFTKVGSVVEYSEVDPTEGIKLHVNEPMMADSNVKVEDVAEVVETGKRNVQIEKAARSSGSTSRTQTSPPSSPCATSS